jgi:opacity protein-like surface antigen
LLLAASAPANAQWFNRFTGHVGGGVTVPVLDSRDRVNTGWNVVAGAGGRFTSNFSLLADFSMNQMNTGTIQQTAGTTPLDGNVRVWSLTLNPRIEIGGESRVGGYFTGGYGLYNRRLQVTQAGIGTGFFCDDWYGFCFQGPTPVNFLVGERDTYKGGFNVGGGMTFGAPAGAKFFAEVRYHRMLTRGRATELLPISFGVRW